MMLSITRQQGAKGCTRQTRPRRLLSSVTNPFPSTPTPAPNVTSLPNKSLVLVSRRQWKKLYKPPPREPRGANNIDDNPWPRSAQILGYGLSVTVVPYCICWYIAANKGIRDFLDPLIPPLVPFLREWFGEEEANAVSYSDRLEEGPDLKVPRSLDMDTTAKERKEQECIQDLEKNYSVPTRLRVFTEGGFNVGEIVDLPGSTLANTKTLLGVLMKDRSRTISEDSVTRVTVEFTDVKEEEASTTGDALVELHVPEGDNKSGLEREIGDMIKKNSIYSYWHYFPEALMQQQQKNKEEAAAKLKVQSAAKGQNAPKGQNDARTGHSIRQRQLEFEISRLNYEIEQLEKQLKDPSTMRSFDDIQEDLARYKKESGGYKSELRRLKWKMRLGMS